MLSEQTIEKLKSMRLHGLAEAYIEQEKNSSMSSISFEERLGMLIDRQWTHQENAALQRRLKNAQLKQSNANIENLSYRGDRDLKPQLISQLSTCNYIRNGQHCIITGQTGTGKTYLSCALGNKACREAFKVKYFYAPQLFRELQAAELDGTLSKFIRRLSKFDLIIIDDWGINELKLNPCRSLLELIDERMEKSFIISSQLSNRILA